MVLIGYHSIDAYKLYSPNDDKLVINSDVHMTERKWWNWTQVSVRKEKDMSQLFLKKANKLKPQPLEIKIKNHLRRM